MISSRNDLRGVRLLIEYLKPELLIAEHGIRHTIVVFGGTRICEGAAARRKVEMLRRALAADTGNKNLERRLAIAERILAKSHYYEIAREFGRLVGEANSGHPAPHTVIMTGGGPGIMEAANRGTFDVEPSVGLNISLPHEQYPNPYVTADLCFSFHSFRVAQTASASAGACARCLSRRLWHIRRAVRGPNPGTDTQDQADPSRACGRELLAAS